MIDLSALDPFALTVIAVLLVVIPFTGIKEFGLLVRWLRRDRQGARIWFYRWVMSYEWAVALGLLAWWLILGRDIDTLGLLPVVVEWQWFGVVAGLLLSFLLLMQMNMVLGSDEHLLKVRGTLGKLKALVPRDSREQGVFLQLSITAGICEEILYRGFLMHVFCQAIGQWPALVLTSIVFGLGHAYQGTSGMAKSGFVGLVLGLLALFSGSILVGMVLHAVLDLTSGRIMQAAVNLPQNEELALE